MVSHQGIDGTEDPCVVGMGGVDVQNGLNQLQEAQSQCGQNSTRGLHTRLGRNVGKTQKHVDEHCHTNYSADDLWNTHGCECLCELQSNLHGDHIWELKMLDTHFQNRTGASECLTLSGDSCDVALFSSLSMKGARSSHGIP